MDTLSIKRISATPSALIPLDSLRSGGPVYSKLVDISKCIGCKGCEVACKEWNDLKVEQTFNFGSMQSHKDLSSNTWLLMRFNEVEIGDDLSWMIKKDACLHCEEPGCLFACPAPGAIVQYQNGIVRLQSGPVHRVSELRLRLSVRHPAVRQRDQDRRQVQYVHRPGRGRARAGVCEDLSDPTPSSGVSKRTCWRWPTRRSRR